MATALDNWITAADAAEIIGVCHSQVTRYCTAGDLPHERFGNQIRILRRDAKRFRRPPRGNPRHTELKVKG